MEVILKLNNYLYLNLEFKLIHFNLNYLNDQKI